MKAMKWVLYALVVGSAVGAGWYFLVGGSKKVEYLTAKLERGNIDSVVSATGSCNAVVSVQVGSQVSGNILALNADFNTRVTKNQVVAVIDPAPFQARMDLARANLESARGQVLNAQSQLKKTEADIANASAAVSNQKAALIRAQSVLNDAKTRLARRKELFDQKVASREELDTAQATFDQAAAALESAQSQVVAAQANLEAVKAQQDVVRTQSITAESQVKQQEANVQQASLDLEHTQIKAPVDGTVIARNMDVGQTVAASFSAPTIFQIAQDLTKMQVDTNIDESDISRIQLGQEATFTVDAYPGQRFVGEVTQVRRAPINVQNVITYVVVISVDNPDQKLFPGMTANVRILTERVTNVLRLPTSALRVQLPEVAVNDRGKELLTQTPEEIRHAADMAAKAAEQARLLAVNSPAPQGEGRGPGGGNGGGRGFGANGGGRRGDTSNEGAAGGRNGKGRNGGQGGNGGNGGGRGKNAGDTTAKATAKADETKQAATAVVPAPDATGNGRGKGGGGRGKGGGRGGAAGGPQLATVFLMGDDGKPRGERVRLGIGDGQYTAVMSQNLQEGMTVITGVIGGTTTQTKAPGFPGGNQGGRGGGGRGPF